MHPYGVAVKALLVSWASQKSGAPEKTVKSSVGDEEATVAMFLQKDQKKK